MWYDLIPVLSWFILKGRCRSCKKSISYLYPLIELLTAVCFMLLVLCIKPVYWLGYSIFISALIITIRSDAQNMLISQYATLYIIPIAWLLSFFDLLPLSLYKSILASLLSYLLLYTVSYLFYRFRKKQGIGEGDMELLATIAAFTGIAGSWFSLMLGSMLGSFLGFYYLLKGHSLENTRIAFGPWLSLGALIYIFFGHIIIHSL